MANGHLTPSVSNRSTQQGLVGQKQTTEIELLKMSNWNRGIYLDKRSRVAGGGNQAKNENFGIDLSVSTWCFLDQF